MERTVGFLSVCSLAFSLGNNHATCYIAVSGIDGSTNSYTLSYHMCLFQNMLLNIKYALCVVLIFFKAVHILNII